MPARRAGARAAGAALAFLLLLATPAHAAPWDPVLDAAAAAVAADRGAVDTDKSDPAALPDLGAADKPPPVDGKAVSIAQRIEGALEKEFEGDAAAAAAAAGATFSETSKSEDATVETVVKVSHKRPVEAKPGEGAAGAGGGGAAAAGGGGAGALPPPPPPPTTPPVGAAGGGAAHNTDRPSWWKAVAGGGGGGGGGHASETAAATAAKAGGGATTADRAAIAAAVEQRVAAAAADASAAAAAADAAAAAGAEQEVDRLIDSQDNEYVLSKPRAGAGGPGLTLDPQLVRDLTVLAVSATAAGAAAEAARQPTIIGYFLAGSAVGPGGFGLVKELVQVESVAQLGVQLLLFALGLEFSPAKVRAVRGVAFGGGALELALFCAGSAATARAIGASTAQGIFIGALVAMSSTTVVVKCLADNRDAATRWGAVATGTLVLQDCAVGLLFATMPLLARAAAGGAVTGAGVARATARMAGSLALVVAVAAAASRRLLPAAGAAAARRASPELFMLATIALCLLSGAATAKLGLSTELGAFIGGAALGAGGGATIVAGGPSGSVSLRDRAAASIEPVKAFFVALFVATTGLVLSPAFLWAHARLLAGSLALTVLAKTAVVAAVLRGVFALPTRRAVAVGLALAQIGEFAFVLLAAGSQAGLIGYSLHQTLMGTAAASLLATPALVRAAGRIAAAGGDRSLAVNGGGAGPAIELASSGSGPDLPRHSQPGNEGGFGKRSVNGGGGGGGPYATPPGSPRQRRGNGGVAVVVDHAAPLFGTPPPRPSGSAAAREAAERARSASAPGPGVAGLSTAAKVLRGAWLGG